VKKPRVLVVDDSAFARTVITKLLVGSGRVEVIGKAHDGFAALERIAELDPDVVTLDLTMPELDGLGVLRALASRPRPRVIVVSISGVDTELGAEALTLGAVDLVTKPTALANDRLQLIGDELVAKVVAAGTAPSAVPIAPSVASTASGRVEMVVLGTSTGGPQALTRLVSALPKDLAVPVAIVLHIPAGYTESLAMRLDRMAKVRVVEAFDGLVFQPGVVALAKGGEHLRVVRVGRQLVAQVSTDPLRPFTPSVDELFLSAARAVGAGTLGIVLTGMGDDGLEGSRAIARVGGALLTESPATCVVYGMPRVVDEARLGAMSLALDNIAAEITRRV
jgi:two-component system chemotaxis response regulator CheB